MQINNNIQIFDDEGNNIDGILCAFHITVTRWAHPLEGCCGVSGAEMDSKDNVKIENDFYIVGRYNEEQSKIITLSDIEWDVTRKDIEIKKVRLFNIDYKEIAYNHLYNNQ